jgi:hypothetical protein
MPVATVFVTEVTTLTSRVTVSAPPSSICMFPPSYIFHPPLLPRPTSRVGGIPITPETTTSLEVIPINDGGGSTSTPRSTKSLEVVPIPDGCIAGSLSPTPPESIEVVPITECSTARLSLKPTESLQVIPISNSITATVPPRPTGSLEVIPINGDDDFPSSVRPTRSNQVIVITDSVSKTTPTTGGTESLEVTVTTDHKPGRTSSLVPVTTYRYCLTHGNILVPCSLLRDRTIPSTGTCKQTVFMASNRFITIITTLILALLFRALV